MAAFKFSLEALLNHRLHHEEVIQKELAVCECRVREEKSVLCQMQHDKNRTIQEFNHRQLQGLCISEHIVYDRFIECLTQKIAIQHEKVAEFETQYAQKRDELIEAVKKRKTIEKLREKKLALFTGNIMRLNQEFLDEVAISRFNKKPY